MVAILRGVRALTSSRQLINMGLNRRCDAADGWIGRDDVAAYGVLRVVQVAVANV